MNNAKIQKHLGSFFLLLGFVGLVWQFYPVLRIAIPNQDKIIESTITDGIYIPKINAYANIIYNVDPFRSIEYQKALQNGVAHAKGTSFPGDEGTSYLFAHSSLPFWEVTHTNTPFLFLYRLSAGDEIYIYRNQQKLSYKVEELKEVWPNEVQYLKKSGAHDLILQTCTPIGTTLKRLLVFASIE